MKIAIGSDHVGYELKGKVIAHLKEKGIEVKDFGTNSTERTDYPIYGEAVANAVASKEFDKGILICGTGVGISLALIGALVFAVIGFAYVKTRDSNSLAARFIPRVRRSRDRKQV